MSSCSTNTCGVGGWGGPQPGDPSNNSILSAVPAFGGIDVSWSLPSTNPHAVAYTKLYRGSSAEFSSAIQIAQVGGAFYYDKLDTAVRYYYWIQIVSVNGTVGELIGPASAVAKPTIAGVIEQLTGQIDAGFLASSLKSELGKIELLRSDLQDEIMDRETGQVSLTQAIEDAQNGIAEAHTFIFNEQASRATADSALAVQLNGLASTLGSQIAAVQTYSTTNVTRIDGELSSQALQINQVITKSNEVQAGIEDIKSARIGYSALNDGLLTPYEGDGSTIVYPVAAYPSAQYPAYAANRTRIIDRQGVVNWNQTPAGAGKPLVWIAGLPLASAVKRVGVTGPAGESATVEQAFLAQKGLNDQLKGQYTVKIGVNGLVGGFGLYNDGATVEAGFDVDRFWIGRTQANKRKPFIIDNGVVYIDEAAIQKLTFTKLRDETGGFMVEGGKLKATYINTNGLRVTNSTGQTVLDPDANTYNGNVTGAVGGVSAGSVVAGAANGNAALSAVINPSTGLNARLGSQIRNVFTGQGGIAVGSVTWDSSGDHPVGSGIGITQMGIGGVKNGQVTFLINTAGDAYFAGELQAARGTFAGSLTADAINAVSTINLAGNSVTVPLTYEDTTTITTATPRNLMTFNFSMPSTGKLICIWQCEATSLRRSTIKLLLDGVEIGSMTARDGWNDWPMIIGFGSPGSGNRTLTVVLSNTGGDTAYFYRQKLIVLGAQR